MPTTYSISAMDTLSSNTAGVDAAKGKTLEEMSDLVQQVNSIYSIEFLLIEIFDKLTTTFFVADNENRRKKGPTGANNQRIASVASKGTRDAGGT